MIIAVSQTPAAMAVSPTPAAVSGIQNLDHQSSQAIDMVVCQITCQTVVVLAEHESCFTSLPTMQLRRYGKWLKLTAKTKSVAENARTSSIFVVQL